LRELGGEESNNDYTLLENFVLFNELSGWLFNFIEEMEKSDPKNSCEVVLWVIIGHSPKLLEGLKVDRKFVVLKDAVNAIAREAYEHDIVLIGHKVVGL